MVDLVEGLHTLYISMLSRFLTKTILALDNNRTIRNNDESIENKLDAYKLSKIIGQLFILKYDENQIRNCLD